MREIPSGDGLNEIKARREDARLKITSSEADRALLERRRGFGDVSEGEDHARALCRQWVEAALHARGNECTKPTVPLLLACRQALRTTASGIGMGCQIRRDSQQHQVWNVASFHRGDGPRKGQGLVPVVWDDAAIFGGFEAVTRSFGAEDIGVECSYSRDSDTLEILGPTTGVQSDSRGDTMTRIGHMKQTHITVRREKDGIYLHFYTYQFSPTEWGFELFRANGEEVAPTTSDPNWTTEAAVLAAIHELAEFFAPVPGYGWCVVLPEDTRGPSGPR